MVRRNILYALNEVGALSGAPFVFGLRIIESTAPKPLRFLLLEEVTQSISD